MNEEVNQAINAVKSPEGYHTTTYLYVLLLSIWGGLVRELHAIRENPAIKWKEAVVRLSISVVTSGFVGLIAFYLCESADAPKLVTAAIVGIVGHMGADSIRYFVAVIKSRSPVNLPDPDKE